MRSMPQQSSLLYTHFTETTTWTRADIHLEHCSYLALFIQTLYRASEVSLVDLVIDGTSSYLVSGEEMRERTQMKSQSIYCYPLCQNGVCRCIRVNYDFLVQMASNVIYTCLLGTGG